MFLVHTPNIGHFCEIFHDSDKLGGTAVHAGDPSPI